MNLIFCLRLPSMEGTHFYVISSGCSQACLDMPKAIPNMSQFHLKNELSNKAGFWHVVRSS